MKRKLYKAEILFYLFIFATFFYSCSNKKAITYFQEQAEIKKSERDTIYSAVIHPHDYITIMVSGTDPEAVAPFNKNTTTTSTTSTSSNSNMMSQYAFGSINPNGYDVDPYGMVDFPVIGQIKLGGLSVFDASNFLKEKLEPYLNCPTVTIRILNYKFTVLGQVKTPGVHMIANEQVTLLEAIAVAGDLTINGERKNVLVIREEAGKTKKIRVDLTSNELFNSPVYYLHQNDIVYVEPNRTISNSALFNGGDVTLLLSSLSFIITLLLLTKY